MMSPSHAILGTQHTGMTPRRAMIIGTVVMLHIAAVYGLMHGMVAKVIDVVSPPIIVKIDPEVPTKTLPPPPVPTLRQANVQPQQTTVPIPIVTIANNDPNPFQAIVPPQNPPTPIADSAALGLTGTHTTPPYPDVARRLTHQGTVLLQMAVTPQGNVASATVVTSSGFVELDQAAVSWVVSHWKYKPAIQNGVAVPSQATAAVKFDLKMAGR